MDFETDRDASANGDPSLADMTRTALSILLKNPKGFFLFVEGTYVFIKFKPKNNNCEICRAAYNFCLLVGELYVVKYYDVLGARVSCVY